MTAPDPLAAYYKTEYHRRNMQVARVCGAQASVDQALERALSIKSIPNWMIAYLESAATRLPGLQHDLAAWRDLAPDAPDYVRTPTPLAAALAVPEVRKAIAKAIFDPGATEGYKGDRTLTQWQVDAVMRALAALKGGE